MGAMPAPEAAALLIALKKRKSDKKKKRKAAKDQKRNDKIKIVPQQLATNNSPSPGRTNSLAQTSVIESELPPNPTTMTNSSPPPPGIRTSTF